MKIFVWILLFLLVINVIAALITVFRKPRSISSVLAWMMTLIFLPGIGFIIYLFCGRGIDGQEVFKLSDDEKQMVMQAVSLIGPKVEEIVALMTEQVTNNVN